MNVDSFPSQPMVSSMTVSTGVTVMRVGSVVDFFLNTRGNVVLGVVLPLYIPTEVIGRRKERASEKVVVAPKDVSVSQQNLRSPAKRDMFGVGVYPLFSSSTTSFRVRHGRSPADRMCSTSSVLESTTVSTQCVTASCID